MWWSVFLIICALFMTLEAAPSRADPYAEDMKNRKKMALECMNEVQINRTVIEKAMHTIDDLPSDIKYKEYLACSYKKQKFQSEEGEMLYDNIVDFLTRFYSRGDLKVLDKCKSITAENDGEMAYNSLKCIIKNLREIEKTVTVEERNK